MTNIWLIFQALTLVKTCEPVAEMRECRAPRDWSLLALQNIRTGKSHYLVICRCPPANILGKSQQVTHTLMWLHRCVKKNEKQSSSLTPVPLNTNATHSFETSENIMPATRRHNPEDPNRQV
jgi:hypothetical protein